MNGQCSLFEAWPQAASGGQNCVSAQWSPGGVDGDQWADDESTQARMPVRRQRLNVRRLLRKIVSMERRIQNQPSRDAPNKLTIGSTTNPKTSIEGVGSDVR